VAAQVVDGVGEEVHHRLGTGAEHQGNRAGQLESLLTTWLAHLEGGGPLTLAAICSYAGKRFPAAIQSDP
jgi:hypothetical protein